MCALLSNIFLKLINNISQCIFFFFGKQERNYIYKVYIMYTYLFFFITFFS